jgi:hypothetical protein
MSISPEKFMLVRKNHVRSQLERWQTKINGANGKLSGITPIAPRPHRPPPIEGTGLREQRARPSPGSAGATQRGFGKLRNNGRMI